MLRDVVATFLDTLTEREFDGPLLALLSARGFTEVHFIHGAFEFGKDVIGKKLDPDTGIVHQYVIQSKAGDIGQQEWRAVRPQLEECEYNTISHPSFDGNLPRVAVLVTTGRLKGSAPADVTEYRRSVETRGLADLMIWERSDLIDWICNDPSVGLSGQEVQMTLLSMITAIFDSGVTDRRIEMYTRNWLPPGASATRASIEAAILVNALLRVKRIDLAISVALQLVRASEHYQSSPAGPTDAARRLVIALVRQLREQLDPFLADPRDLARRTLTHIALLTYPVICCRSAEALGLGLALAREASDASTESELQSALEAIAWHPGTTRPPGDLFVSSVIVTTVMLNTFNREAAEGYLRRVTSWFLDRHDENLAGLGLAAISEDEQTTAARLLGGSLAGTTLERRRSSYLATALLDLALYLKRDDLYEALRDNIAALRVVPESTRADETKARWCRGGDDVWPVPRVDFEPWILQSAAAPLTAITGPVSALLLAAACRSRHYPGGWGLL